MPDHLQFETADPADLLAKAFDLPRGELTEPVVEAALAALARCGAEISGPSSLAAAMVDLARARRLPAPDEGLVIADPAGDVYSIKVTRSLWMALGVALDAAATHGFASAALTALGVTTRTLARLSPQEGEVCVYRALAATGALAGDALLQVMHRSDPFNGIDCKYKREGACILSLERLQSILERLRSRGVLATAQDGAWRLAF